MTAGELGRRRAWPLRRWPTVVGILFAGGLAATFWIGLSGAGRAAEVLVAAGFVYLGSAALGRREAAWPLFALTFAVIGVGFALPGFDPLWAMVAIVAALAIVGAVRGRLRPAWGMPLQAAAMVALVGVAVLVAVTPLPGAAVIVGAGLLAHAAWDVHHLRARRVVASSLAEFCAALDTTLALAVIAIGLLQAM